MAAEKRKAPIATIQDYCTRMRGAECERCRLACPADAISYGPDERPAIDGEACTRCGICLGICDAFTSTRVSMDDVHDRFRRIALRGEEVVVTCSDFVGPTVKPASNVVVLPCLACLSPEFWTLVLAENMTIYIAADLKRCSDCARAGEMGEMLYSHAVATAEAYTGRTVGYQRILPKKKAQAATDDAAGPNDVGRREAFASVADDVLGVANGTRRLSSTTVLNEYAESREKTRARRRLRLADGTNLDEPLRPGMMPRTLFPKRALLLEALACDPDIAERIEVTVARTDPMICENAGPCRVTCPTGARQRDSFEPRLCVGCGLCAQVCYVQAIELVDVSATALLP